MNMFDFKKIIFIFSFICLSKSAFLQSNEKEFNKITEEIENLLRYKEKSPSQLHELMGKLEALKSENEKAFDQLKLRVDAYLLPIEIQMIRSDIFNKEYKEAVLKTKNLKINYAYKKEIGDVEDYLDRKLYRFHKNKIQAHKPSWFSIEPSVALYSKEKTLSNLNSISNLTPVYSFGIYSKFNNKKKISTQTKTNFSFSQFGVKLDFRDKNFTFFEDSSNMVVKNYFNPQLSILLRKTIGLDFGIIDPLNKNVVEKLYSISGSIYLPIKIISIGVNAKFLTDFKSTEPLVQLGTTFKFNLGFYKSFKRRESEEVKSQVIKFKESI